MSRVEENKAALREVNKLVKECDVRGLDATPGVLGAMLIDISKSLAVIADALSKDESTKQNNNYKCKFRSAKNCAFCAFHSDCDEHYYIEGDEK